MEYRIPFVGLKNGIHQFHYEIDSKFFSLFDNSEIKKSQLEVDLNFDKHDNFFILDFSIGGTVNVDCDRCSENIDQEILDEHRVYVKFDDDGSQRDEEDDVVYISTKETHLDVSQLIYELTYLSIPIQKICPDKKDGSPGCNEAVMKILEQNTPKDNETDPRWTALKNLNKQ